MLFCDRNNLVSLWLNCVVIEVSIVLIFILGFYRVVGFFVCWKDVFYIVRYFKFVYCKECWRRIKEFFLFKDGVLFVF